MADAKPVIFNFAAAIYRIGVSQTPFDFTVNEIDKLVQDPSVWGTQPGASALRESAGGRIIGNVACLMRCRDLLIAIISIRPSIPGGEEAIKLLLSKDKKNPVFIRARKNTNAVLDTIQTLEVYLEKEKDKNGRAERDEFMNRVMVASYNMNDVASNCYVATTMRCIDSIHWVALNWLQRCAGLLGEYD